MATKTISTPSAKYPGWTGHTDIQTDAEGNEVRRSYWMTSDLYPYAIELMKSHNGKWYGELLTQQKCPMTKNLGWEVARNPFDGEVAATVREAERRGRFMKEKSKTNR
jgi:hypothetical protein